MCSKWKVFGFLTLLQTLMASLMVSVMLVYKRKRYIFFQISNLLLEKHDSDKNLKNIEVQLIKKHKSLELYSCFLWAVISVFSH